MKEVDAPITVLVVDDQHAVRDGIAALLGLLDDVDVRGRAGDGQQALELLTDTPVDVVLLDLRMPVLDGVAATERIAREHPGTAVVVLTTYSDDESIAAALRAGARGYLTKDAGRGEIAAAIRAAAVGQATFDRAVSERLSVAMSTSASPRSPTERLPDGLTAREAEILGLIAEGLSNAEIAGRLFVGAATVKTHINNAFAKIGARNRADAVRYAYRSGLGDA